MAKEFDDSIISLNPRIDIIERYFDFNSRYKWISREKTPRAKREQDDYRTPQYLKVEKWPHVMPYHLKTKYINAISTHDRLGIF